MRRLGLVALELQLSEEKAPTLFIPIAPSSRVSAVLEDTIGNHHKCNIDAEDSFIDSGIIRHNRHRNAIPIVTNHILCVI